MSSDSSKTDAKLKIGDVVALNSEAGKITYTGDGEQFREINSMTVSSIDGNTVGVYYHTSDGVLNETFINGKTLTLFGPINN